MPSFVRVNRNIVLFEAGIVSRVSGSLEINISGKRLAAGLRSGKVGGKCCFFRIGLAP